MRILQLISSSGFFGAESMIVSLMKGLSSTNCHVALASLLNSAQGSAELSRYVRNLNFQSFEIPCGAKLDLRSISELRRITISGNYDIVHSHGYKADLYSRLAINGSKRVRIATVHNWPCKTFKMRAFAALDKFALRSFTRIVAVSDAVAEELVRSGVPLDRITLVENGIDATAFRNGTDRVRAELKLQSDVPVIGYVGRFAPEKGLDVLLNSIPGIVNYCPDAQVMLVGDGPLRNQLAELAQTLGIASRVRILGIRSDMADLYRAMDIFVLPSRDEGFPMTILEAMAAGKAVVASSVGQIPHVIRDHETGLLVQPGARQQLTDAIVELLLSPQVRERLGLQGKRLVDEQFTAEVMAKKYFEQYRQISDGFPGEGT
jgi:glycosyltransferase involved in cell wall biosynthesis